MTIGAPPLTLLACYLYVFLWLVETVRGFVLQSRRLILYWAINITSGSRPNLLLSNSSQCLSLMSRYPESRYITVFFSTTPVLYGCYGSGHTTFSRLQYGSLWQLTGTTITAWHSVETWRFKHLCAGWGTSQGGCTSTQNHHMALITIWVLLSYAPAFPL